MLLFVGSGCAALIYEIVWFQMLQLVIGATGISLGLLLGTFMGGMFLGSLALPRLVSRGRNPLRVYAAIEIAIGVVALAILVLMPAVNGFYAAIEPRGLPGAVGPPVRIHDARRDERARDVRPGLPRR
jgi:spermidine synthase